MFSDALAITIPDERFDEERFVTMGRDGLARVLVVVCTLRGDEIRRKIAHAEIDAPEGKGCYWDEHSLVNRATNATISYPQWEWADLDGKRLVWAAEGNLYAAEVTAEGLTNVVLLCDFNDMQFQPIAAPY